MLDSIFAYLMVLFFSKSVLLTSSPIDLDESPKLIVAPDPLTILNGGAALYIHMANISREEFGQIIMNKMQYPGADKFKPAVCDKRGSCISLVFEGIALQEHSVEAIYRTDWHGHEAEEFSSVRISSDVVFHGITLTWANSGK